MTSRRKWCRRWQQWPDLFPEHIAYPIGVVSWIDPNPNSCWDCWGDLDGGWPDQYLYLSNRAPQMQMIERIITEVTRPRP
ncbi:hypothetical protein TSA66_03345 [Noviherbaspirillum autotrophicum]|uniref:Uncharacterized protein n=1 Tax=Noviherbaspirillum autotrophicum TaxID=709839 RepID=A0A0C2BJ96_9BURK|nr:hypothetical protein TSA66_03345 [Noviherbaspirillum autotrophicum]